MKKLSLLLIALSSILSFGQNNFPPTGFVSVGTTTPLAMIHVNVPNN